MKESKKYDITNDEDFQNDMKKFEAKWPNPKKEKTMTTQNIDAMMELYPDLIEKRYILIHFYNSNSIILMVNDFAMDYIITHSHEIESMEYIDLVIPAE